MKKTAASPKEVACFILPKFGQHVIRLDWFLLQFDGNGEKTHLVGEYPSFKILQYICCRGLITIGRATH